MATLLRLLLRWELWNHEMYVADCRRTGVIDSLDLAAFDRRAQALRVRIAELTPRSA